MMKQKRMLISFRFIVRCQNICIMGQVSFVGFMANGNRVCLQCAHKLCA